MSCGDDYWSGEIVLPRTCVECERIRPCVWIVCPYLEDIYEIIEYGWWCASCHYQSCMDI